MFSDENVSLLGTINSELAKFMFLVTRCKITANDLLVE